MNGNASTRSTQPCEGKRIQDQTAIDYFLMRMSELEFRVRQTENYIKLADELKELKASQKKTKVDVLINGIRKEYDEKIGKLEATLLEFESRHTQQ